MAQLAAKTDRRDVLVHPEPRDAIRNAAASDARLINFQGSPMIGNKAMNGNRMTQSNAKRVAEKSSTELRYTEYMVEGDREYNRNHVVLRKGQHMYVV